MPYRPAHGLAVALAAMGVALAACSSSGPGPVVTTTIARPPSSDAAAPSTSSKPKPPTPAQLRATAEHKIAALLKHEPSGAASYAALNVKTGTSFSGGQRSGMWTASASSSALRVGLPDRLYSHPPRVPPTPSCL